MNAKTLLSLNVMASIIAVASIAMIGPMSGTPAVIADDEKVGLYKMADDVQVIGTFEFRDGTEEVVNIPDFNQNSKFSDTAAPSFGFNKAVTYTPILHQAADAFWMFGSRSQAYGGHHYNDFGSTIDIYQGGKHIRQFKYSDCMIIDYAVKTLEDKEEAYMGKGFAVIEEYEIECTGYVPHAMDFKQMKDDMKPKRTDQISSLDLLKP